MNYTNEVVWYLEDLLEKAKTGELDSIFVIATRANVSSGGVAYVGGTGNLQQQNAKLRDALTLTWSQGMRDFSWPPMRTEPLNLASGRVGRSK